MSEISIFFLMKAFDHRIKFTKIITAIVFLHHFLYQPYDYKFNTLFQNKMCCLHTQKICSENVSFK